MKNGFEQQPAYRGESDGRIASGCAIGAFIDRSGRHLPGKDIVALMAAMRERSTDLGAGYAGYGIYPKLKDFYAFHVMYASEEAQRACETILRRVFNIARDEAIPTRHVEAIADAPVLRRYFVRPNSIAMAERRMTDEDEFVRRLVIHINADVDGAFVFSSGKNMGVFKGVGFPEDIAEFFRIDEYDAYCWIAHGRFPTNTPGWWGGAHPFSMLNWSIVHNGEISSYGINQRYLEQFGYRCTLMTDTEVMAYMVDLLVRVHGLPPYLACKVMAPPFWNEIDRMDEREKEYFEKPAHGIRAGDGQRPVRHRLRLRARHVRPQRPHKAAPDDRGRKGRHRLHRKRGIRHPRGMPRARPRVEPPRRRAGHRGTV